MYGDRRTARRVPRLVSLSFNLHGERRDCVTTDVSSTGAFLSSAALPRTGRQIELNYRPNGGPDVVLLGEVVWLSDPSLVPLPIRGFAVRWLAATGTCSNAALTRVLFAFLGADLPLALTPERGVTWAAAPAGLVWNAGDGLPVVAKQDKTAQPAPAARVGPPPAQPYRRPVKPAEPDDDVERMYQSILASLVRRKP